MAVNNHINKYLKFGEVIASYLAIMSFLLVVQYHRAPKWKLFIDHSINFRALLATLAASSLILLYGRRQKIRLLLGTDIIRVWILCLALVLGIYFRFHILELIVFLYTVYALLFAQKTLETNRLYKPVHNLTDHILEVFFDVESRTPAALALLLLVSIPFLIMMKKSSAAESVAIYFYYLLVITVVLQIREMKLGIEKKNRLLALVKQAFNATHRALTERDRILSMFDAIRQSRQRVFTVWSAMYVVFLAIILASLYSVKTSYWKTIEHTLNTSPERQSEVILGVNDSGTYVFPSYAEEITVPIKIKHPLSNPLWWSNEGAGAVSIGIAWLPVKNADGRNRMFEDYQPLPRPLFINDSVDVQLKLKRPDVPMNRAYEVRIGLSTVKDKWVVDSGDKILKLRVQMEQLSGDRAVAYEHRMQDLLRNAIEEEWSNQLFISQSDYRSKIEISNDTLSTPSSVRSLTITNKGGLPWPVHNQHPVKLGVAWIQKNLGEGTAHLIHVAEDTYPLPKVMFPGDNIIVDVALDPRRAPDADEIWIGMVHDGRTWFHDQGDAVIKMPNKDKYAEQQLPTLLRKNKQLEKELDILRGTGLRSSEIVKSKLPVTDFDYRSKIQFAHDLSENRLLTVANRLPLELELTNMGNVPWIPSGQRPVNLGILWFNKSAKVTFESPKVAEERCIFPFTVLQNVTIRMQCAIGDRLPPGDYEVWIGLVHEGTVWFLEKGDSVLKLNVTVH